LLRMLVRVEIVSEVASMVSNEGGGGLEIRQEGHRYVEQTSDETYES